MNIEKVKQAVKLKNYSVMVDQLPKAEVQQVQQVQPYRNRKKHRAIRSIDFGKPNAVIIGHNHSHVSRKLLSSARRSRDNMSVLSLMANNKINKESNKSSSISSPTRSPQIKIHRKQRQVRKIMRSVQQESLNQDMAHIKGSPLGEISE